jgi:hypothetical protein
MKKYILIALVASVTLVALSSCSAARYGCPDTRGLVGYK